MSRHPARLIAPILVAVLWCSSAFADSLSTLQKQLDDSSARVRLQAATSLQRIGDKSDKTILAFVKHLNHETEDDKLVRQASASALGLIVTSSTSKGIRGLAIKALEKSRDGDPDSTTKSNAREALKAIGVGSSGSGSTADAVVVSGAGGIYVNTTNMASNTKTADDAKFREVMLKTTSKTLSSSAKDLMQTWPGGGSPPTNQQAAVKVLVAKQVAAFYVDGTLNTLTTTSASGTATIACKVSMLIASYPNHAIIATANGGAKVQDSDKPAAILRAKEDCISAVMEDLIASKIVPTIRSQVKK